MLVLPEASLEAENPNTMLERSDSQVWSVLVPIGSTVHRITEC